MKNHIADLEALLRKSAEKFGITLREKSLVPYMDPAGIQHFIIPDLLYEDGDMKVAIEIGGEFADREKNENRHFKDTALKEMGYTVIYLDIERDDAEQIEICIAELRKMIADHKEGIPKANLPEYLGSTFSLQEKLQEKIRARKSRQNNEVSEVAEASSAISEPALLLKKTSEVLPAPERNPALEAILNGKKMAEIEAEKTAHLLTENKSPGAISPFLLFFGGSVITLILFFLAAQLWAHDGKFQNPLHFAANLLEEKSPEALHLSPAPIIKDMPKKTILENSNAVPQVESVVLPAHSLFSEAKGVYVLSCSSNFQADTTGQNCISR